MESNLYLSIKRDNIECVQACYTNNQTNLISQPIRTDNDLTKMLNSTFNYFLKSRSNETRLEEFDDFVRGQLFCIFVRKYRTFLINIGRDVTSYNNTLYFIYHI
ncbi:MAG: hypothetical protein K8823_1262 [Cenarchaeum symbiont of Oopsacas minuta]|nr:hypothetical protein [Cenarchaeum symbiont of Oopsacas minuta]